jgi:hypothetical protein
VLHYSRTEKLSTHKLYTSKGTQHSPAGKKQINRKAVCLVVAVGTRRTPSFRPRYSGTSHESSIEIIHVYHEWLWTMHVPHPRRDEKICVLVSRLNSRLNVSNNKRSASVSDYSVLSTCGLYDSRLVATAMTSDADVN